jgi:SpoVK/Ycf46/Vps4 family AAA+-type ATPase
MEDVVKREGIVIKFSDPYLFIDGMRVLRQIQPKTPVVVILEDIDSTLQMFNESEILNILDGVNEVKKIVFLATTNYPEKLGARIVNRPSRFDKRFRIGYPSKESRKMYFEFLIGGGNADKLEQKIKELDLNIDQWVEDTEDMSIAHLKELFVQVIIIGDPYEEAIETLKSMKEDLVDKEEGSKLGFTIRNKKSSPGF